MSMTNNVIIPEAKKREAVAVTVATDGIRLPRATSGPVLDLDLVTMAEQLRNEAAWSDGRNSRTLVKHGDFRTILTVMKAGARLHRHHARGTVLIQVLSGQIQARVLDDVLNVRAGHALSLDPHLEHEIEAVEVSSLLITIAWPQEFGLVHEDAADRLRRVSSFGSIASKIETPAETQRAAA